MIHLILTKYFKFLKIPPLFLVIACLMITLLIDTSFIKIYDLINKNIISIKRKKIIFSIRTALSLLFQFFIIQFTKKIGSDSQLHDKLNFRSYNKIASFVPLDYYCYIGIDFSVVLF